MVRTIIAAVLALSILSPVASAAAGPDKPNFVLIMADDLGYGDVGWHGGPYKTPHLDRLAAEGIRLEQHYSLPVCSPTRSSLLSGRFNSRFGCTTPTNNQVLPPDTITLAIAMRSVGYETALFGKWHLGSKPEWGPQHYGFGRSYGSLAGGVTSNTHLYKSGEYAITWHRDGKLVEEAGHVTDLITREAVQFIGSRRDKPFFLYVPYTAVHLPIDEPAEWLELYKSEPDEGVRQYGACVSHLDHGVGQIVAALDKAGLRQNTVVLFISDNGGSIGTRNNDTKYAGRHPEFAIPARNGPFRGSKASVYEGGIRTPAVLSWPGRFQPRQEQSPVHVADWFPTFAAIAGYRPQQDLKWDGVNLLPMLEGKERATNRAIYLVGPGNNVALRRGNEVLVRLKGKPDELYDLQQDPSQKQNIARERPQQLAELQDLLKQVSERDNDASIKPRASPRSAPE